MTPPINAPRRLRDAAAANTQAHRTDALFRRWLERLGRS